VAAAEVRFSLESGRAVRTLIAQAKQAPSALIRKDRLVSPVLFEPALQVPKASPLTQLDGDNECGDSLRSGKLAKEPNRQQTCNASAIRFIEERLANLQKIGSYTVVSTNRAFEIGAQAWILATPG
jgi:hypothetical protein